VSSSSGQQAEAENTSAATDNELISHLDELVFSCKELRGLLDTAHHEAASMLHAATTHLPHACVEVNIQAFKERLPGHLQPLVNLCRVFLLKRGHRLPSPERHRNSTQRLVSFKNSGAIHIADSDHTEMKFCKFELVSPGEKLSRNFLLRWNIVPPNTWHYPEASSVDDWCTVAFHSASSTDIVDEYLASSNPD